MDIRPVADYSKLQKPLPTPPKGYEWYHEHDAGEWKVVESVSTRNESNMSKDVPSENDVNVSNESTLVTHIVQTNDTLQGICLKV